MDETLLYLAKTWYHIGICDHNWTYPAKCPNNLRTFLRTSASKLPEIKNKNKKK